MTELLQIMTDDLNILEKINGIKKIKKIQGSHPGRKDNTIITNFEGFPSDTNYLMILLLLKIY